MKHYNWFLQELPNAGRENLDQTHVSLYDKKEDADAQAEVQVLQELGLNHNSVLIDFGTGTGQLALVAARVCAHVVAVDVSPVMLKLLKEKVRASGLTNLDVVEAGFLSYEPTLKADFAYSRLALHHLPDFWKTFALTRMRSVLREGGVLRLWDVVYSFEPHEAEEVLENWCRAWDRDSEDGWTRADVEEHIRDEHSTFTWLLEPMIARSNFRIEQAEYSADKLFAKYVARAI
jgi:cyclopropane fatty-acyl-phospholipid synthase-like methyltransferase